MRKLMIRLVVVLFCCGCHDSDDKLATNDVTGDLDLEEWKTEDVQLTMWSFYDSGWEYSINDFRKEYPNVSIEVKEFPYDQYEDVYFQALFNGYGPDIMVFSSAHFSNFIDIGGLENLLEPPYNLASYEQSIPESLWQLGQSFDREKMIGIPFSTSPVVTFYRPDLLEPYGYPTEPEELAEYMSDATNWLEMARTLKQDDKWMIQWITEIAELTGRQSGLFDHNMNFLRNNDDVKESLELAKIVNREGLSPGFNLYDENGQQALREDRFAMFYQGTWGEEQIKGIAPEQNGLWRVTRLPLDLHVWDNGNIVAIPAASEHKEAAWAYIEHLVFEHSMYGSYGSVPAYIPARTSPETLEQKSEFFGGQEVQKLYHSVMEKTVEPRLTPVDQQVEEIWHEYMIQGVVWDMDSDDIIDKIMSRIDEELNQEIAILKDYMKED
ncbi:ABC transporter substrate-binding protein [Bacillus sp. JCM 19034]|uniref:ABC transporter substrate-binding protein n=1 Tax=Bacillus sp. JCM 19034 TaxID=1481928 RepID=UPI0007854962|nr:extracellular solute-binding protein [Bacillus sp. JCM 19034]